MDPKKPDNIWHLLIAILIPNAGGWIVAALWQDRSWFESEIVHPSWRPPNWIFPIVWTIVYSLMGIASYYVFKHGEGVPKFWAPLGLYGAQLLFNWLWLPLFFIWHFIFAALVDLVILWILVALTIVLFWKVKRKAALLLCPYITWLTIAVALNAHYYYLNKDTYLLSP